MNRKYFATIAAITIAITAIRVTYSLILWRYTADSDMWMLLADSSQYLSSGHYTPQYPQSIYYGMYSVGIHTLVSTLSVFTGINLFAFAQYPLQIITPVLMTATIYIIASNSGENKHWCIPLMILYIGTFNGLTHQQSRMIEECVGYILFFGALLLFYLYYNGRSSKAYTFWMLTALMLATVFTHQLSFIAMSIVAMPFVVRELKFAALAYIPLVFLPWYIFYSVVNGYVGAFASVYPFAIIGLVALYAVFMLIDQINVSTIITRIRTFVRGNHNVGNPSQPRESQIRHMRAGYVLLSTFLLGLFVIGHSFLTRFQSGYIPYLLPIAPLVVYAALRTLKHDDLNRGGYNKAFYRYLVTTLIFLSLAMVIGFIIQFEVGSTNEVASGGNRSVESLSGIDIGGRLLNWVAVVYGIIATMGLIQAVRDAHNTELLKFVRGVVPILIIVSLINVAVLALNFDRSFNVVGPVDSRAQAGMLWTVGKDSGAITLTDNKNSPPYRYYTGELVASDWGGKNSSMLEGISFKKLRTWSGYNTTGIDYLFVTTSPDKFFDGKVNVAQGSWDRDVEGLNNIDRIDKVYTNGFAHYYKVEKDHVPKFLGLYRSATPPQSAGTDVTWTVVAYDQNGGQLKYKFFLSGPSTGFNFTVVQDWSTNNTWVWHTTANDVGYNQVAVHIMNDYDIRLSADNSYDYMAGQRYIIT